ncbi:MAG: TIR domain-containing protein [Clostridia bacterium]|nr:TIR domain-containing protein [Clostridia bacterium]
MVEWTIHAYEGTEPYIFVSYAHADAERIQPFLHAMSNFGLNVWFDEGIHSGSDWRETILNHLGKCSAFVFFVTEASLASKECKKEIYFAERKEKPFINVVLGSPVLPDWFIFDFDCYQYLDEKRFPTAIALAGKLDQELRRMCLGRSIPSAAPSGGVWVCVECGNNNPASEENCEVCGTHKSAAPKVAPAPVVSPVVPPVLPSSAPIPKPSAAPIAPLSTAPTTPTPAKPSTAFGEIPPRPAMGVRPTVSSRPTSTASSSVFASTRPARSVTASATPARTATSSAPATTKRTTSSGTTVITGPGVYTSVDGTVVVSGGSSTSTVSSVVGTGGSVVMSGVSVVGSGTSVSSVDGATVVTAAPGSSISMSTVGGRTVITSTPGSSSSTTRTTTTPSRGSTSTSSVRRTSSPASARTRSTVSSLPRVGERILFGNYPQECVKDTALRERLGNYVRRDPAWKRYQYYASGRKDATLGYMFYCDKILDGQRYRGVYFEYYRPANAKDEAHYIEYHSHQLKNGYICDRTHWFKYAPIAWTVVEDSGDKLTLVAEDILDSQGYHCAPVSTAARANTFATSELREWLNVDFMQTAFTLNERRYITSSELDNSGPGYSGAKEYASIYLLSAKEAVAKHGIMELKKKGTDYAKCQGLYTPAGKEHTFWWTRKVADGSASTNRVRYINHEGMFGLEQDVATTSWGVVPALTLLKSYKDGK